MSQGTKISQLDFVNELSGVDYFPLARGSSTKRISGLTLINAITALVPTPTLINADQEINLNSNAIHLSGSSVNFNTEIFNLTGSQIIETNSLSAALRVTQTGSGNVIEIEDSAYPDSTLLKIDNNGNIVLGTATLSALPYTGLVNIIGSGRHLNSFRHGNNNTAGAFYFYKTRGINESNHVILSAGDKVTVWSGNASNGNEYLQVGRIEMEMDPNSVPSVSSVPSRILFSTTSANTTANAVNLLIDSSGNVGIGTGTNIPNEKLTVHGNISATTFFGHLSGNTETASRWLTPRKITLSGNILGDVSFDGTSDVILYTQLSSGLISNNDIAETAQISDVKLATISSPNKVDITALNPAGSDIGFTLVSTGSATSPVWQSPSLVTTSLIQDQAITTPKLADEAVTLTKTTATSANTYSSLVARNQFGEFAATNIYSNLEGNASTANRWQTPRQISFEGAITGTFAIDGSTDVTVPVQGTNLASAWLNFNGTQTEAVSCEYIQDQDIVTVYTPAIQEVVSLTGIYAQGNSSIPNSVAEIYLLTGSESGNVSFAEEYLIGGSRLNLTFLSGTTLDPEVPYIDVPNGEYTVLVGVPNQFYINVATTVTQYVTGEVIAEIVKTTPAFALNHLSGHILNLDFRDGVDLQTGTPISFGNLNTAGLYTVLSSVSSNTVSVSSTLIQESSGSVNIIRQHINNSSNIVSVTPKAVGNYILNIYPSLANNNYMYTGTCRVANDDLSVGSVTTLFNDIKTDKCLEIRTVLNNGSLSYFDSTDTNVIIYG